MQKSESPKAEEKPTSAYDIFMKKIQEEPVKPSNNEKPRSAYEKYMEKI